MKCFSAFGIMLLNYFKQKYFTETYFLSQRNVN